MKKVTHKKWFEEYAWVIFLILGIVVFVGGIPHFLGVNTDPILVETISGKTVEELQSSEPMFFDLYDFYFRGGGLSDVGFGFFLIVITLNGYRKGEKWAWYALCSVPVWFLAWVGLSVTLPAESQAALYPPLTIIIVLSLLGLILPFRKFFPKKG